MSIQFKLQWRNKTGLLVELLAPLVLFTIVAYVRSKQGPKEVDNVSFAAQVIFEVFPSFFCFTASNLDG